MCDLPEPATERLVGVIDRVTFHSPATGWSVLQVTPVDAPHTRVTVTLHQARVYAGASVEFRGSRERHPVHGEQFRAVEAIERKPASLAALEKYLGSGLIRGVGPKTARKIVRHFGATTLEVFDARIDRLIEVRGIARKKLQTIAAAWSEHQAVRHVMMFLQEQGLSTLFSVKIYRAYGNSAIDVIRADPYRLARDIYGIGFFSADRIAASLGFEPLGQPRLEAAIRHVLAASREAGHCFLIASQVERRTRELLGPASPPPAARRVELGRKIGDALVRLAELREVRMRSVPRRALRLERGAEDRSAGAPADDDDAEPDRVRCYYSRTLYRDERTVAREIAARNARPVALDASRVRRWLERYGARAGVELSEEQRAAVAGIAGRRFSILTGGPGCGKTTTVRSLVHLVRAMGLRTLLAAPTGRAAQRLGEVVGQTAGTIHRLLEWNASTAAFSRDRDRPLETDFIVVDECSMLDVSLAASLLSAVPEPAQILFAGDPHQLPSIGAGDVLADLLRAPAVPRFELTRVFRQARASQIVRFAHAIRDGALPAIPSPIAQPRILADGVDCLFLDAEEATREQLRFLHRARAVLERTRSDGRSREIIHDGRVIGRLRGSRAGGIDVIRAEAADADADVALDSGAGEQPDRDGVVAERFTVPRRFLRVDLEKLARSPDGIAALREVLGRIHPHSTLHHGLSLTDAIIRLYTKTIPERLGPGVDLQILTPMNRGSAGAEALNRAIQEQVNPRSAARAELRLGTRLLRVGDRVIQRRNNYDLGVFNGDIGRIVAIDAGSLTCTVAFSGDLAATYARSDLFQLDLAYAITIHKSQGSEFGAVVVPVVMQHVRMLHRALVYTALTRGKRLAVFVGERRALALAVRNADRALRQTALAHWLDGGARDAPGRSGRIGAS